MASRKSLLLIVFVLFAGCEFNYSCGGKQLDRSKLTIFLSGQLETATGLKPSRIECPKNLKSAEGRVFECVIEVGGVEAVATLKQQDADGYVTVESVTGLIIASKLEANIGAKLEARTQVKGKIDCGPPVRESKPGANFECVATDPNGATLRVGVTVNDTEGNVDFEVLPAK